MKYLNKYSIAVIVFTLVLLFFDKNNLFTQIERTKNLKNLNTSIAYFKHKIEKDSKELQLLNHQSFLLEKYAREKYLMKKKGEDVFLIDEPPVQEKN